MKYLRRKLAQFKQWILSIVTIRFYSEKQLDEKLTEQRQICCDRMDEWCERNNLKKCGHIVLYVPRPK